MASVTLSLPPSSGTSPEPVAIVALFVCEYANAKSLSLHIENCSSNCTNATLAAVAILSTVTLGDVSLILSNVNVSFQAFVSAVIAVNFSIANSITILVTNLDAALSEKPKHSTRSIRTGTEI